MDKLKQWIALTVLGCVAIVAAGWFLVISPKRTEAADVREQAVTQEAANSVLRTQLKVLRAQAKELPKNQADLARVAAKIPDNPSLPALIRALTAASTTAGVEFVSVTPGEPIVAAAAAVAPVAPAGAPAVAPAGAAPAPAPATAGAPAAAPADVAAAGAAGTLAEIPVTINVVGGFFEVEQFLANLENLPRALRVKTLSVAPGVTADPTKKANADDGSSLASTISGSVFMAANRPAATPVVAPAK